MAELSRSRVDDQHVLRIFMRLRRDVRRIHTVIMIDPLVFFHPHSTIEKGGIDWFPIIAWKTGNARISLAITVPRGNRKREARESARWIRWITREFTIPQPSLFFLIDEATGARGRGEQDLTRSTILASFRDYSNSSNGDVFEGVLICQLPSFARGIERIERNMRRITWLWREWFSLTSFMDDLMNFIGKWSFRFIIDCEKYE